MSGGDITLRYSDFDTLDMEFDPEEFTDCESEDDLTEALENIAFDQLTRGIAIQGATISDLFALVEKAKSTEETTCNGCDAGAKSPSKQDVSKG